MPAMRVTPGFGLSILLVVALPACRPSGEQRTGAETGPTSAKPESAGTDGRAGARDDATAANGAGAHKSAVQGKDNGVASARNDVPTSVSAGVPGAVAKVSATSAKPESKRRATGDWAKMMRAHLHRPTDFVKLTAELKRKQVLAAGLDEAAVRAELEKRALAGDAEAALTLGLLLRYGELATDKAQGEQLIASAAESGNSRAMAELGRILLADETRADGPAQAEAWLRKAWAAGEGEGAFLLASAQRLGLLDGGRGETWDALLWAAAERGNESARWLITDQYYRGELEVGDGDQVRRWLDALAEGGDLSSMVGAANVRLRNGDVAGALPWLERAVAAGSDDGCAILLGLLGRGLVDRHGRAAAEQFLRARLSDPTTESAAARWELAKLLAPQATEADARAELLALLAAAGGAQHYRAGVALKLIEQGRDPAAALGTAQDLSDADAYAMYSTLWATSAASVEVGEGGRAPRLLHSVMPVFPAELAASRQAGEVMLRLVVGRDGRVDETEVLSSAHPAFSAAAIEAARQWVFEPAVADGREVAAEVRLKLRFKERE